MRPSIMIFAEITSPIMKGDDNMRNIIENTVGTIIVLAIMFAGKKA